MTTLRSRKRSSDGTTCPVRVGDVAVSESQQYGEVLGVENGLAHLNFYECGDTGCLQTDREDLVPCSTLRSVRAPPSQSCHNTRTGETFDKVDGKCQFPPGEEKRDVYYPEQKSLLKDAINRDFIANLARQMTPNGAVVILDAPYLSTTRTLLAHAPEVKGSQVFIGQRNLLDYSRMRECLSRDTWRGGTPNLYLVRDIDYIIPRMPSTLPWSMLYLDLTGQVTPTNFETIKYFLNHSTSKAVLALTISIQGAVGVREGASGAIDKRASEIGARILSESGGRRIQLQYFFGYYRTDPSKTGRNTNMAFLAFLVGDWPKATTEYRPAVLTDVYPTNPREVGTYQTQVKVRWFLFLGRRDQDTWESVDELKQAIDNRQHDALDNFILKKQGLYRGENTVPSVFRVLSEEDIVSGRFDIYGQKLPANQVRESELPTQVYDDCGHAVKSDREVKSYRGARK
jgi:hypothetical protein